MKLGPHLHRIGNDIVAAYLVETPEGITLIDAGLPGHWHDLQNELKAMNRPIDEIRGVILTHGDSDHIGFAERLRRERGVPVYVHTDDADRARGAKPPKTDVGPMRLGPTLAFFGYALRKRAMPSTALTEVVEVEDEDVLPLPGAPEIIAMPGHSPGSIAIHVPIAEAVFVGDALTTRHVLTGRTGGQPAPFTDEPERALESLSRIADLDAAWVLPGHGAPWHGSPRDLVAAVRTAAAAK